MHPAIIIGTVRSLIVDVAMGQIPRSTERISSLVCDSASRSCAKGLDSLLRQKSDCGLKMEIIFVCL